MPINENGRVEYTDVVRIDSTIGKDRIYAAVRSWFTSTFKDGSEVLQVQDKEAGELVGKGNINIPSKRFGYTAIGVGIVWFKISVFAKDGRYRYSITDFKHEGGLKQIRDCGSLDDDDPDQCSKSIFQEVKEKTNEKILLLIKDMNDYVILNTKKAKDDW
jgi:hypothetical protein